MAFSRSKMFYGNYSFTPVPLFSWSTDMVRDGKGDENSLHHTLDFTGTILVEAGESGHLDTILIKRLALQNALASGNQKFKITYDGNTVLDNIYPRVNNVSFDAGVWTDRIDYSFQLEYDEDFYNTGIQAYNESWQFEEQEDRRTVTARHDISAVGIDTSTSGNNALLNARSFVLSKIGYSNVVSGAPAFVQVSGTYSAYEELRTESNDVGAGSFSLTEVYTLSSGTAVHVSTGQFAVDDNGVGTVTLEGNIKGLGRGDKAYPRALQKWRTVKGQLPSVASGVYLDLEGSATLFTADFNTISITRNQFAGTINYSVSYTDSPAENLPSGIKEFGFNISDQEPIRVFASFGIPQRTLGNVVQDVGTSTEGTFTIQGNAVGKVGFPLSDLLNFIEQRVNANRPQVIDYITLRLSNKQITKDIDNNTVQFNISWTYTKDLSTIDPVDNITID